MSTNATIAIHDPAGTYRHIYCHHDGYLEGVGLTLIENYTTREEVNQLLDLGDCSSLEDTPDDSVFYGRDRGETDTGSMTVSSYDDLLVESQEYCYVFVDGRWNVVSLEDGGLLDLETELRKEMEE